MRALGGEIQLCESPFGLIPNLTSMQMYAIYGNKIQNVHLKNKKRLLHCHIFRTMSADNSMCMVQYAACTAGNINRMLLRKIDLQGLYALEHELDGMYSFACFLAQLCITLAL